MATNIVVPQLSESIQQARVAKWLKREGERVDATEAVVELETEKVNVEVGAERAGVLARVLRREGDDVRSGDVLGVLEDRADAATSPPRETAPAPGATAGASEVRPPASDRAEAPPPEAPRAPEDRTPAPQAADALRREESAPVRPRPGAPDSATPLARRLAQERGVDIRSLAGSGPGGRVTRQDVERHLAAETPARGEARAAQGERREERVRLSMRRLTIARRLVEAQQTAVMLTTFNEADMGEVMQFRERHKTALQERYGHGLGVVTFFVKAVVGALKAMPVLNAELQGDELVLKHYYDIGVAVGAETGLVVPVIRDADRLSLIEIERAIRTYVEKIDRRTISVTDLRGGTFTITNGGVFGSLLSTPVLNPPQVGILGLHRVGERPVVRNGAIVVRPMMYLALTYDHRVVDGRDAVQFLARVKDLIERPETMLLVG
jgi:2-oxoglutarate dehydrogenase E2 component (dihydrolipoamide succinyltransferase)